MEEMSSSEENTESPVHSVVTRPLRSGPKRNQDKRMTKKSVDVPCKSKRSVKRKLKTFTFGKWQRGQSKDKNKRTLGLNRDTCRSSSSIVSESSVENVNCICSGSRKTRSSVQQNAVVEEIAAISPNNEEEAASEVAGPSSVIPVNVAYACSNAVQVPGVGHPGCQSVQQPIALNEISLSELTMAIRNHLRLSAINNPLLHRYSEIALPYRVQNAGPLCDQRSYSLNLFGTAHTQVDYVHYLVPDLLEITNCGFYWGKMDRYKAEKQLDKKPEGTFLLRDSAQEEYLFSVSFRRYGRTLHARIEQLNHKFSFDSHDPNVFTSDTVCGLVEHYKNPQCCMFFEPMLTIPVHRSFPFDLQHLCRAVISENVTYDHVNCLELPKKIKSYLKEYHYKQKVRVRHLENDV